MTSSMWSSYGHQKCPSDIAIRNTLPSSYGRYTGEPALATVFSELKWLWSHNGIFEAFFGETEEKRLPSTIRLRQLAIYLHAVPFVNAAAEKLMWKMDIYAMCVIVAGTHENESETAMSVTCCCCTQKRRLHQQAQCLPKSPHPRL